MILLAPAWYSDEVAAPLLQQVAEQADEFARHGYDVVLVGERAGVPEALHSAGVTILDSIDPPGEEELEEFLARRQAPAAATDRASWR